MSYLGIGFREYEIMDEVRISLWILLIDKGEKLLSFMIGLVLLV